MVDICMPVVECGYVPFFADVLFINIYNTFNGITATFLENVS
jgi:hypothetical protein